ncbi:MAG: phospholipid carrier-dependent glycosyltransferase [Candidatus Brocadiia bacterium]
MTDARPAPEPRPESREAEFPLKKLFPWFMLIVVLIQLAALNGQWWFQRDSALYMSLARSLAETGRYAFNYRVHTYALPGLPAMLAPIYATLGESFLAMNVLISAYAVGAVGLAYLLFRRVCRDKRHMAVCLVLFGLSYPLLSYSTRILTEMPFTFFVLLTLYCGTRLVAGKGRSALGWSLAAGAAAFAALCTRPFGLALFPALLCAVWLRPESRANWKLRTAQTIAVLGPLALALLAWWLHSTGKGVSDHALTYADFFIGSRVTRLAARILRDVPELLEAIFKSIGGGDLDAAAGAVLSVPLAVGLTQHVRRGDRLLAPFGLIYLAGVCVGSPGVRYVLPVLPVLLVWLVEGGSTLGDWLAQRFDWATRRRLARVGYLLVAAALLTHLARSSEVIYFARSPDFHRLAAEGRLARYRPLVRWMKDNVGRREMTLAHEHRLLHYLTRVECWRFPKSWFGIGARPLARHLADKEVRFVVLDPTEPHGTRELRRLMRQCPDCFEHVRDFSELEIYRLQPQRLREFADLVPRSGRTSRACPQRRIGGRIVAVAVQTG